MSDTKIKFLNSGKELTFNNLKFIKRNKIPFENLDKVYNKNQIKKSWNILNTDEISLATLEEQVSESLSYHRFFLNSNFPPQVDIEIVREKKTEQLEYYLRQDNKFFFKTIQEYFLSDEEIKRKNRKDKISAESVQRNYSVENIPRLKLSTDFAKEFNPENPPKIFDKFLTELRKTIPNSVFQKNITNSTKIITELMVLHESAHIILDEKINKTYLKAAYELKNENYKGDLIQQFVRLIHEGFADGLTTYLAKEHYPNNDISMCYRNARNNTKHKTALEDNLNIYDTVAVIDKVNNSTNLKQNNVVNYIFELAVNNALGKLQEKTDVSKKFKDKLVKDLTYLEDKNCFKFTEDRNIVDSLKQNIFNQLSNPLPIVEILSKEKGIESKKQTFKNMDSTLNKFRFNTSTSENKLKL